MDNCFVLYFFFSALKKNKFEAKNNNSWMVQTTNNKPANNKGKILCACNIFLLYNGSIIEGKV